MKAVKFALVGTLLAIMQPALAEVDLACKSNCLDRGYNYDFCTEKCSYGRSSEQSGGYQPSGALGAMQQGQRQADMEAKQQLDMIKQMLEIQKMKQELEIMRLQQQQRNNN